jgi:hypothetical protein
MTVTKGLEWSGNGLQEERKEEESHALFKLQKEGE